jgi:hypothetical protein
MTNNPSATGELEGYCLDITKHEVALTGIEWWACCARPPVVTPPGRSSP